MKKFRRIIAVSIILCAINSFATDITKVSPYAQDAESLLELLQQHQINKNTNQSIRPYYFLASQPNENLQNLNIQNPLHRLARIRGVLNVDSCIKSSQQYQVNKNTNQNILPSHFPVYPNITDEHVKWFLDQMGLDPRDYNINDVKEFIRESYLRPHGDYGMLYPKEGRHQQAPLTKEHLHNDDKQEETSERHNAFLSRQIVHLTRCITRGDFNSILEYLFHHFNPKAIFKFLGLLLLALIYGTNKKKNINQPKGGNDVFNRKRFDEFKRKRFK